MPLRWASALTKSPKQICSTAKTWFQHRLPSNLNSLGGCIHLNKAQCSHLSNDTRNQSRRSPSNPTVHRLDGLNLVV
jgi:hypothetical protein